MRVLTSVAYFLACLSMTSLLSSVARADPYEVVVTAKKIKYPFKSNDLKIKDVAAEIPALPTIIVAGCDQVAKTPDLLEACNRGVVLAEEFKIKDGHQKYFTVNESSCTTEMLGDLNGEAVASGDDKKKVFCDRIGDQEIAAPVTTTDAIDGAAKVIDAGKSGVANSWAKYLAAGQAQQNFIKSCEAKIKKLKAEYNGAPANKKPSIKATIQQKQALVKEARHKDSRISICVASAYVESKTIARKTVEGRNLHKELNGNKGNALKWVLGGAAVAGVGVLLAKTVFKGNKKNKKSNDPVASTAAAIPPVSEVRVATGDDKNEMCVTAQDYQKPDCQTFAADVCKQSPGLHPNLCSAYNNHTTSEQTVESQREAYLKSGAAQSARVLAGQSSGSSEESASAGNSQVSLLSANSALLRKYTSHWAR